MTAAILREAAAVARERAEAAPDQTVTDKRVTGVWLNSAYYLTTRPDVEAAVADSIDSALMWFDPEDCTEAERGMHDALLAVARAYLATP